MRTPMRILPVLSLALCLIVSIFLWRTGAPRTQAAASWSGGVPITRRNPLLVGATLAGLFHRATGRYAFGQTAFPTPAAPGTPTLGAISGRVTLDGGRPAAGFTVRAFPACRPFFRYVRDNPNTATTDADGRYTITMRPMNVIAISGPLEVNAKGYTVSVSNGGRPYVEPPAQTADPDAKPGHAVTGVDFVLRLGPEITVRARDAITGAPDPGLTVRYGSPVGVDQTAGITGPDGVLRFRVPLTDIRLQAELSSARQGPLESAPGYGVGTQFYREIKAAPGQAVSWEIKTYGPARESDWHGVVLGPDDQPAAGVPVTILRSTFHGNAALVTDAQGRFSTRMPRLDQSEVGGRDSSFPAPVVYARSGALVAALAVTPDESWEGMTLHLAPGAALSGTLVDPQGRPATGVGVSLTGSVLSRSVLPAPPVTVVTNAAGRFTLDGLPPGDYGVRAHGGGYGDLAFPAFPHGPESWAPRPLLAAGQRLNLGRRTVFRADRTLTGRVVDTQGGPASGLFVRVSGAHTSQTAATQRDGTFHVYDLVAEPLVVAVGVPDREVTATVAPGQAEVRLVAPPDVVATNGDEPTAPSSPAPLGPPRPYPQSASASLNGLALTIRSDDRGGFAAAILRPNSVGLPFSVPVFLGAPGMAAVPTIWQGTLADLEGMRLTVRAGRGTLSDRDGRSLWSGVVQDPPDYVVTTDRGSSACTVTVCDGRGVTLWSGPADRGAAWDMVRGGNIRVVGPDHRVVWERAVGDARVAVRTEVRGTPLPFMNQAAPQNGTLTLHTVTTTATLRSVDGSVLWSQPAPAVTITPSGFAPPPPTGGGPNVPLRFRWLREPHQPRLSVLSLLNVRDAPPGATLSFTDATGQAFPVTLRWH